MSTLDTTPDTTSPSSHTTPETTATGPDASPTPDASPAPGASLASDVRMATFRLARRLRSQRAVDTMSDGQFAVLAGLMIHGPHTLGELAERERVSAPSMNRTVNCLEELGYITRTTDDTDRRKVNIDLTDAGRAVVDETVRRRDSWLENALESLDPAQRAVLSEAAAIMREVASR